MTSDKSFLRSSSSFTRANACALVYSSLPERSAIKISSGRFSKGKRLVVNDSQFMSPRLSNTSCTIFDCDSSGLGETFLLDSVCLSELGEMWSADSVSCSKLGETFLLDSICLSELGEMWSADSVSCSKLGETFLLDSICLSELGEMWSADSVSCSKLGETFLLDS